MGNLQSVDNNKRFAVSSGYETKLWREGSSAKTFITSALIKYFKAKHPKQNEEYEKETAAGAKRKVSGVSSTPSVSDVVEAV